MENWIALVSDLCVMVFDLLLYTQMITLRGNKSRNRWILYTGCVVIVGFYIWAVAGLKWPAGLSSFICMSLPSLVLFWLLSEYRDARFFLTFCLVDTLSLIVAFVARYMGILFGNVGSIGAIIVLLLSFVPIYWAGKPFFQGYRDALRIIDGGWTWLTCCVALIYGTLIFCSAYPKPLIERPEYGPVYLVISLMVVSFYVVFVFNIFMTKKMYEQSIRLKEQQKWFRAAFVDAVTEIPNRAAYMEKIHALERAEDQNAPIAILVMDLDHFKVINDTWGHSAGDAVLKQAAKFMTDCFRDGDSTVYRIGGDEFAVIALGITEDTLLEKQKILEEVQIGGIPYSLSSGYSFVDRSEKNATDRAFERADAMMYAQKSRKSIPGEH